MAIVLLQTSLEWNMIRIEREKGRKDASVKHGNTVHALIELSRGVPIYGHYGHYGVLRVTMEILWEHYACLHSTAHGSYYI